MPITAFIGVRISWLIVARKALLASFAVSAAARASWVCLNSRAFWIAITAWSAKVLSSAISLSENGLGGWRIIMIEPIPRSSHSIGTTGGRVVADEFDHVAHRGRRIGHGSHVGHVNGTSRANDPRRDGLIERPGEGTRNGVERRPAPRGRMHQLVVAEQEDAQLLDGEQVPATVEDLVEHRCGVGHRTADHLQHLGRGGLLLQRLLGLVEQPHVLDRDHRLVGEGLEQPDVLFGEGPHLGASHQDRAEGASFAHQRHRKSGAMTILAREFLPEPKLLSRVLQIRDVHRPPVDDGTPHHRGAVEWHSLAAKAALIAECGRFAKRLAIAQDDVHDACFADSGSALGHRIQNRLDVARSNCRSRAGSR